MTVGLKNNKLKTFVVGQETSPFSRWVDDHLENDMPHNVLKVTLKGGDVYVIDIAAAQYGYREAVWRWDSFTSRRLSYVENMYTFGKTRYDAEDLSTNMIARMNPNPTRDAIFANGAAVAHRLESGFSTWMASHKTLDLAMLTSTKTKADASVEATIFQIRYLIDTAVRDASETKEWMVSIENGKAGGDKRSVFVRGDGSRSYSAIVDDYEDE